MNVTFTRTGERRYRVSVDGPGVVPSFMEPAPGYDPRLPHDMAHFVVENELGITGGVFGQLAAGGHAGTFRPMAEQRVVRRVAKRGRRLAKEHHDEAMLSEQLVGIACQLWNGGVSPSAKLATPEGVTLEDLRRVCAAFDAVSAVWSKLAVAESMTLEWRVGADRGATHRRGLERAASRHRRS